MPAISCSDEVVRALAAARAVALDREPVRLVANLLQQVQARVVGRQVEHRVALRKHDVLLAGLALRALRDADQPRVVQALLGEHLRGDRDLPLAAVDHEQVGRRKLAGDDARAAPRQRLAHRRVVVAARRPASR